MKYRPPEGATLRARRLRGAPTDAEMAMWRILREAFPEARFRRQVPIRNFITDFASHRVRLVIEADGGQHGGPDDQARTKLIEAEGYRVLRFWNSDILSNADGVVSVIAGVLTGFTPTQPSPIKGEG